MSAERECPAYLAGNSGVCKCILGHGHKDTWHMWGQEDDTPDLYWTDKHPWAGWTVRPEMKHAIAVLQSVPVTLTDNTSDMWTGKLTVKSAERLFELMMSAGLLKDYPSLPEVRQHLINNGYDVMLGVEGTESLAAAITKLWQ